jgi:hypothetical protein
MRLLNFTHILRALFFTLNFFYKHQDDSEYTSEARVESFITSFINTFTIA